MGNELIKCSCGCSQERLRYDKRGRDRRYINHHRLIGFKHTKKSKEKMRKSHMGRPTWNKGLTKDTDGRIDYMRPTSFKKGNVPWSKGLKLPQMSGENHPMYGKKT